MQRVLLSCKSGDDAQFLKSYVEAELPFEVVLAHDLRAVEAAIKAQSVHLLMLQTGDLAVQDVAFARSLRQLGFAHPVLMITDEVGNVDVDEISEKYKLYFLERPFELRTLKGLARKLVNTKIVPQQIFRRYRTNVNATLETFISGERYDTHMFNLSRGGAYFELGTKPVVQVGDLMRLRVRLSDFEREHAINGRVVWTTHKGHSAGGYGLGLKFMKNTDIYRSLRDQV